MAAIIYTRVEISKDGVGKKKIRKYRTFGK